MSMSNKHTNETPQRKSKPSKWTDEKIVQLINDSVLAGIAAGKQAVVEDAKAAFSYTERRIRAYHPLLEKIQRDKKYLDQVLEIGSIERSKSILRYTQNGGSRLSAEEKLEAVIASTKAEIAKNEFEAEEIGAALEAIHADEYYFVIEQRYFHNKTDDEIANLFHVDKTTVWRNRVRLVSDLAVRFFGSAAFV